MTLGTNKYVHETSCTGPWVHNKSRYSRTTQVSSQLTFAALTPLYKSTSEINKVQYSESHIYIYLSSRRPGVMFRTSSLCLGPTGILNTKVLYGIQTFCLCIPIVIELCYSLLLSLHSITAVSVHPSLLNS